MTVYRTPNQPPPIPTGILCAECNTDVGNDHNHVCGTDPFVTKDDMGLEEVLGLEKVPGREYVYRCKFCYSFVGKQHFRCGIKKIMKRFIYDLKELFR